MCEEGRPVAVVTGATGGMGRAIVADLATTHRVIAIGRAATALAELETVHGATAWQLDLAEVDGLAERLPTLDRLDALVHAAAVCTPLPVAEASVAQWYRHLTLNVIAPAELTRVCLPALRRSRGDVVFIGSGASTRPVPANAVYTASKHALKGLADVLRMDEASHGVRVTTVSPGQTDTAMLRASHAAAGAPYEPEKYIRPASVARAVRFVLDAPPDAHTTDVAVRPRRELSQP